MATLVWQLVRVLALVELTHTDSANSLHSTACRSSVDALGLEEVEGVRREINPAASMEAAQTKNCVVEHSVAEMGSSHIAVVRYCGLVAG